MLKGRIMISIMGINKDVIMEIMVVLLIGINVKVTVLVKVKLHAFKTLLIIFIILLLLLIQRLMKFLKFWIIQLVDYLEMEQMEEIPLEAVALLIMFKFFVEVIQHQEAVMEVILEVVLLLQLEIVHHQIFW